MNPFLSIQLRLFFLCLFCSTLFVNKSYAAFPIRTEDTTVSSVYQELNTNLMQTDEKQEQRKSSIPGFTSLGLGIVSLPTFFFLVNNVDSIFPLYILLAMWGIGIIAGAIGLGKKRKHKWAAWLGLILCGLGILFILFVLFMFYVIYGGDPS